MADERRERLPGQRPRPDEMSTKGIQPGRQWIPRHGPYKGKLGAEKCATKDFQWLGLTFPGEVGYHIFNIEDLKPDD